jgi:NAD(P)-dependent dehydrogenase (short-subunit alcohol dehydrogenase family)/acyl carrier protein
VRPDVDYFKFDLYEINPALFRSILEEGIALVEEGAITPLPVRRFAVRDIASAFRTLAQGQNVGKIILDMPEDSQGVIRGDRSYLITGGLGGLGLVMAAGLADSGARHLALVGRRPPNEVAQAEIERLRQTGVSVTVFQADIGIRAQAETLFAQIDAQLPALGGVLHAAGVLDDGVVMSLDRARLATSMAPKVAGTMHLHELTLRRNLDFFVLFSSISATLGAAGQANYSAANAFMDAVASSRAAQGLPGLSVGWGAWAVAGMAAELVDRFRAQRAAMGLRDIPPAEGVIAMNTLLEHSTSGHVVAMPVQWSRYLAQYLRSGAVPPLFLEVAGSLQVDAEGSGASSQEDVSLITEIRGADAATRMVILKGFIARQAAATVGTEVAAIDDTTTLVEVGVDSLIAMELRTRINRSIGVELPLSVLVGASTIVDVANKIAEAFDGNLQRAA